MRSNKTIGTNRLILGSITLLVFVFWILDVVMRQLPSPIPIWWTREIIDQLILSSSLDALWRRPWTLVTYSLLHNNGMHLLLNLLLVWLLGQMLLRLSTPRQFGWCYVGGAVVGGIAFVLFTSLLRVCGVLFLGLPLVGASASVVALVGYMIGYAPRQEMPLPLIGYLRVWQIGLLVFLLLLLAYGGYNLGGLIAHLAGISWGLCLGIYHRHRQQVQRHREEQQEGREIAYRRLLDKVEQSGYQSLSEQERELLIEHNKQLIDKDKC